MPNSKLSQQVHVLVGFAIPAAVLQPCELLLPLEGLQQNIDPLSLSQRHGNQKLDLFATCKKRSRLDKRNKGFTRGRLTLLDLLGARTGYWALKIPEPTDRYGPTVERSYFSAHACKHSRAPTSGSPRARTSVASTTLLRLSSRLLEHEIVLK